MVVSYLLVCLIFPLPFPLLSCPHSSSLLLLCPPFLFFQFANLPTDLTRITYHLCSDCKYESRFCTPGVQFPITNSDAVSTVLPMFLPSYTQCWHLIATAAVLRRETLGVECAMKDLSWWVSLLPLQWGKFKFSLFYRSCSSSFHHVMTHQTLGPWSCPSWCSEPWETNFCSL